MVERRLTQRDQAGLPQPAEMVERRLMRRDQAGLLQPAKPAGISQRSSRHTCRTRDNGGWHILLRLPFTHRTALKSAVARVYLGLLIFISNLLSQSREFVEWEDQRVAVTCVRRGWERRVPIFTSGTNPNSVISRFRSGILGITHLHLKFAFASAAGSAEKKNIVGWEEQRATVGTGGAVSTQFF